MSIVAFAGIVKFATSASSSSLSTSSASSPSSSSSPASSPSSSSSSPAEEFDEDVSFEVSVLFPLALDEEFEAAKSATNRGDSLPRATALAFVARAGRGRVPRNLKRFCFEWRTTATTGFGGGAVDVDEVVVVLVKVPSETGCGRSKNSSSSPVLTIFATDVQNSKALMFFCNTRPHALHM
jgi:hypothetical protein